MRSSGAALPRNTFESTGTSSIARTSWVAAWFIAAVTEAGVSLPVPRFCSSSCTRCTEPIDQLSSVAR